jgi:ATP-dependent DNA ligase
MGAIIDQAKNAGGENEEDMESAIKAFAGGSGADELKKPKPAPPEPRITVECVIVGFTTTEENREEFASLVLAGAVKGKLKVIGTVSSGISAELRQELNEKMPTITRSIPFVESTLNANWIEPELTCSVTCQQQAKSGRLIEIQFKEMLAEIDLSR